MSLLIEDLLSFHTCWQHGRIRADGMAVNSTEILSDTLLQLNGLD